MRTKPTIAVLASLLCPAAMVAAQPQSEAVMIIPGIPGEIPISLERTDWSQIRGMPDPRTPQRAQSETLGRESANPLTSRGSSSGRDSGRAGMQDMTIEKFVDTGSREPLDLGPIGQRFPEVVVEVRHAGSQRRDRLVIKMRNVGITRIEGQPTQPDLRGGRATEAVTFRCQSLEWEIQRTATAWRPSTPAYPITPRPP
jgi:type VI protein secretion system component Hcp